MMVFLQEVVGIPKTILEQTNWHRNNMHFSENTVLSRSGLCRAAAGERILQGQCFLPLKVKNLKYFTFVNEIFLHKGKHFVQKQKIYTQMEIF